MTGTTFESSATEGPEQEESQDVAYQSILSCCDTVVLVAPRPFLGKVRLTGFRINGSEPGRGAAEQELQFEHTGLTGILHKENAVFKRLDWISFACASDFCARKLPCLGVRRK